jgi:hypothetical protein
VTVDGIVMNFSDEDLNALPSICFNDGGDSNDTDRIDEHLEKPDSQRLSIELGIHKLFTKRLSPTPCFTI